MKTQQTSAYTHGFTYSKSYGNIVVEDADHIKTVNELMRLMDEDEYDMYCPKGLVRVGDPNEFDITYIGKFAIDLQELKGECLKYGITFRVAEKRPQYFSLDWK